ncbi:hypothetical protein AtubIFM55763_001565 [Aspergillus tubingensis]|uniref:AAA+ ATPase domain-containing protein n=2 Tax=Aspergillus subgen. Circumdati TaxID=2720871 RepID=A0A124BV08_ASPNG|nr:AAA family ATPase [Aspergillus tubingensis]GAQ34638.1 hypothetical protein TRIATDRAFT_293769 [Aspergillus niger]GFN16151.1 AAA family ATPase [Aspergillus tubingensis]GLA60587.1 hypothetical protein AtubIFM54640_001066 [Aspergillus tubingensis]GLA71196.1 hypothetical protein AtubIFM55763_001565 [Aspergillus tubingensis]GLA85720.1 hypothetical protein AtubIFM56815_009962 [Aspergillus tubingensis]
MANPVNDTVPPAVVKPTSTEATSSEESPSDMTSPVDIAVDSSKDDTPADTTVAPSNGDDNMTESEKEEESWEDKLQKTPKVVDIKWVDFEHFKNCYSPSAGLEIIQVLRGHPQINHEIMKEYYVRQKYQRKMKGRLPKSIVDAESSWIQRVRIQSPPILLLLSRLSGHNDNWAINKPRVFFPPFRAFYYYLPRVKECLGILEAKWAKLEAQGDGDQGAATKAEAKTKAESEEVKAPDDLDGDTDDELIAGDDAGSVDPEEAVAGPVVDSVTGLRHLRRYIKFVEAEIVPLWNRAAGTSQRKVRFLDLWMSFQPGELLYAPPRSEFSQTSGTAKSANVKMYQSAWRLYSMVLSPIQDDYLDDTRVNPKKELTLYGYYIDYNGSSYGPVRHKFKIPDYAGERDITTLEVYPMRFAKDSEAMMKSLRDQGSQFQNFVRERHYYDGWTLVHGPTGDPDSEHRIASEHIDGDVIIDFLEGYKAESSLSSPSFDGLDSFDDTDWPVGDDELYIKHWINGSRSKLLGEITETTQRGEWFGDWLTKRRLKEDRFLRAWEAGTMRQLGGDDLALLPRRVIAYAFRERKFVMVDICGLKKKDPAPQNVFKDLKIDRDHKRMVRSLVKTHFAKQEIQKQRPNAGLNQDLIRGKGSGLVILLHGVPGVGKTATAEAVAQANNKPLFVITCGDLGFTPKEVDASLKDIFRLAHLWDCVLLLDEADVFLSRREVSDLKRNALVSVFLRVLEYYSGILFLTTNRVGTLDEAFKSRIHVSLYYPPLDKDQTLSIFELNIRKLIEIQEAKRKLQADGDSSALREPELAIKSKSIMDYAKWHYDTHEQHERWNGRQIRNAFQIAYSLAHYEMERNSQDQWDEDAEPNVKKASNGPQATRTLDYRQFVSVAKTIERFDDYLYDAIACTNMDNARDLGLRADDHDPNMNHRPDYRPQPPRTRRPNHAPALRASQQSYGPPRPGPPRRGYSGQGLAQRPRHPGASRPKYQPPGEDPDLQPEQRPGNSAMPQRENGRLPPRLHPSQVKSHPRPTGMRRGDDYSGWSTHETHTAAVPDDDYFSDDMDDGYDEYVDGHDQDYDDEYEEGH